MARLIMWSCIILLVSVTIHGPYVQGEPLMIAEGKTVKFDYVLTVDGKQVDSSETRGPLEYVHGESAIIKGLEMRLEGLTVGENKTITVPAEEGYGAVDPEAFQEVAKSELPSNLPFEVGQMLAVQTMDGKKLPVVISEVKDESVVIDFNHPLAGKELTFKITVVEIN